MNPKTVDEALELPFDEYLRWCHDWCRAQAKGNPIFQDVYSAAAFAVLEAGWARRYWFHYCNKLS